MRSFDPEANRDTVVKKINSLRTAYRKELKKVIASEKSGAGDDDIYVPHLWYFDQLHFLKDQDVPRQTKTNIEEVLSPDNETNPELFPDSASISLPPTPSPTLGTSCTSERSRQPSNKTTRGVKNKCDDLLEVIGKRLCTPSDITTVDKFSHIGKAWASKLRDLDTQQAVHAEKIINDVFYEAQLGNLNRNCFLQVQQEHISNIYTPYYSQHSSHIRPSFNVQPPFSTQQPLQIQTPYNSQPSFNNQPRFDTRHTQPSSNPQPSFNNQPSFDNRHTQPSSNPQPSFNAEPPFDTRHTQPSSNPEPSFNTEPPFDTRHTQPSSNPQPSFNTEPRVGAKQGVAELFRNFSGFKDGGS